MIRLVAIFLLLFCCTITDTQAQKTYAYYRSIQSVSPGWHQIDLPAAIFPKSARDFKDLRLYYIKDKDTLAIPYMIKAQEGVREETKRKFKRLNESKNKEGYYFTFENKQQAQLNEIILHFKEENFDWRLNLEGSNDQKQWFSLLENYRILSIKNGQTDYQFTKLNFPLSNYRFLRVQLVDVPKCKLKSAEIWEKTYPEGEFYDYGQVNFTVEEKKDLKQTIIDVHLAEKKPVSQVELDIVSELDYYRHFRIQNIKDSVLANDQWKHLYQPLYKGVLSSLETPTFTFPYVTTDRFQIVIANQDNLPVHIKQIRLKSIQYSLQANFPYEGDYFLAYGNPLLKRPNYDIQQFKNHIPEKMDILALEVEQKGNIKTTTDKKEPFWLDNPLILWLVMGLIILVMGGFTLKMIRGAADS